MNSGRSANAGRRSSAGRRKESRPPRKFSPTSPANAHCVSRLTIGRCSWRQNLEHAGKSCVMPVPSFKDSEQIGLRKIGSSLTLRAWHGRQKRRYSKSDMQQQLLLKVLKPGSSRRRTARSGRLSELLLQVKSCAWRTWTSPGSRSESASIEQKPLLKSAGWRRSWRAVSKILSPPNSSCRPSKQLCALATAAYRSLVAQRPHPAPVWQTRQSRLCRQSTRRLKQSVK
mmetsp:Transcript_162383/g.287712  ORF Transcript_162383/g.287712 Transcript_162383/m.287712 type:complete len:228 (-) Transcript_162383:336-1019(-)